MIYEPAEDSFLLADQVKKLAFGKVIDVGTGSGIQAKAAASSKRVSSVVASDISNEVVSSLKKNIGKKIKIVKSDLFENIHGSFDTIIFNPPYLPRDTREPKDSQLATTGGKHGYEILCRFVSDVNNHLARNGIVLIVFSSLTKKDKIDKAIADSGFEYKEVARQNIPFEILYVYKIQRSDFLDEFFSKKITNIQKIAKGHRGFVFTGTYKGKKIAIKVQRPDIPVKTIDREAVMIRRLNKHGIAPKLLFTGKGFFGYQFVLGEPIWEFLEKAKKKSVKNILGEVLRQCRILDALHITKEEMHNPYKHIIIGKKVVLIDFERAHYDVLSKNVTQFCQYILSNERILSTKGIRFDAKMLMDLARRYKSQQTEANYNKIKDFLDSS